MDQKLSWSFHALRGAKPLVVVGILLVLLWVLLSLRTSLAADTRSRSPSPAAISAAVSPVLTYQGRLLDPATGAPKADGTYAMAFRLYNVASGGSALWTESKSIAVSGGLFSTLLGDTTALNLTDFVDQDLWLGISVGSDPEATPRQRIGYSAYAIYALGAGESLYAYDADRLDGLDSSAFAAANHSHSGADIVNGTITTDKLANGSVTTAKIAAGVIPEVPKFLTIDPASVRINAGTFNTGFGANAGIRLPDSGTPNIALGFTIPPNYSAGTALTLRLVWHTPSTNCGIVFAPNFTSFARPGRTHLSQVTADAGLTAVGGNTLTAPGQANQSNAKNYSIFSPETGTNLQPGDSIMIGLYRASASSSDTCTGDLVIQGIQITYQ